MATVTIQKAMEFLRNSIPFEQNHIDGFRVIHQNGSSEFGPFEEKEAKSCFVRYMMKEGPAPKMFPMKYSLYREQPGYFGPDWTEHVYIRHAEKMGFSF